MTNKADSTRPTWTDAEIREILDNADGSDVTVYADMDNAPTVTDMHRLDAIIRERDHGLAYGSEPALLGRFIEWTRTAAVDVDFLDATRWWLTAYAALEAWQNKVDAAEAEADGPLDMRGDDFWDDLDMGYEWPRILDDS